MTIRDFCGDCGKLADVADMEEYEGDRYCAACVEAIKAGAAEFYGETSAPSPCSHSAAMR